MTEKIAAAMPGKMGDALYTLPSLRYLGSQFGPIDFYTTSYCIPLEKLFLLHHFIGSFNVIDHHIDNFGCGVQPWEMNIPDGYDRVYQMGFRRVPDKFLATFIAEEAGLPPNLEFKFDVDYSPKKDEIIHIFAPRGASSFSSYFYHLAERLLVEGHSVWVVGGRGDYQGIGMDLTNQDLELTTKLIAKATFFHGLMSSQLVLANGFKDMVKIVPHDGKSWDMRHVLYSPHHYYLVNPSIEDSLNIINSYLKKGELQ